MLLITKVLLLLSNLLSYISCANFDFSFIWFENNSTVSQVYHSRQELPASIENATKLILNQRVPVLLRSLDLEFAKRLKTLVLSDSQISDLEPGCLGRIPSLDNLTLSGNEIRTIKDGVFNFIDVGHLDLSHNKLSTIKPSAFDHMPGLLSIKLDYNELTAYALSFNDCPKLNSISVQYNFIQYLADDSFKNLARGNFSAYFSYNKITKVHEDLFDVKEFKDLYLDHNEMKYFEYPLNKIDTLNLNVNRIECVSKDLMNELSKVKRVLFFENPLNCSCYDGLVKMKNVLVARPDDC